MRIYTWPACGCPFVSRWPTIFPMVSSSMSSLDEPPRPSPKPSSDDDKLRDAAPRCAAASGGLSLGTICVGLSLKLLVRGGCRLICVVGRHRHRGAWAAAAAVSVGWICLLYACLTAGLLD